MIVRDFAKELEPNQNTELLNVLSSIFQINQEIVEFIGSHPVGLAYDCIEYLLDEDYYVCEKTDGIRLMMFIYNGIIYFYDRKNVFYQTDLIINTNLTFLFDGEMYIEKDKYIYSMFDCLIYDSLPKVEFYLNKRLGYCFEFEKVIKKGCIKLKNDSNLKRFYIIGKNMSKSYAFTQVLDSIKTLSHDNDGLIFTPVNRPYLFYSRSNIFKWKPPNLNTVDFLIKDAGITDLFYLYCTANRNQIESLDRIKHTNSYIFCGYYINDDDNTKSSDLDNVIGEFIYDFDQTTIDLDDLAIIKGKWCLHRIRTDKNTPNNVTIVLDTLNSLENLLKAEDLKKYQDQIRDNYKKRSMEASQL